MSTWNVWAVIPPISGQSKRWAPHSAAQVRSGRAPWPPTTNYTLPLTVVLLVVLLVASTSCVDATKLKACGARLQEIQGLEWNATHNSTEPPPPLSLSYEQCLAECGTGLGGIDWRALSQSFSAWLLPWIALMFQIPFGAEGELHILSGS